MSTRLGVDAVVRKGIVLLLSIQPCLVFQPYPNNCTCCAQDDD